MRTRAKAQPAATQILLTVRCVNSSDVLAWMDGMLLSRATMDDEDAREQKFTGSGQLVAAHFTSVDMPDSIRPFTTKTGPSFRSLQ